MPCLHRYRDGFDDWQVFVASQPLAPCFVGCHGSGLIECLALGLHERLLLNSFDTLQLGLQEAVVGYFSSQGVQTDPVAVQVGDVGDKAEAGRQGLARHGYLPACCGDSGQNGVE